ncbi:hypothetical protein ACIQ6K_32490 [Streptomyces sp. NPDC096354]|uniref:hypothetical protein n=1 Tax=Streptomyces sp. NPDC096354 TaxID=3366088 RepID=UPI0038287F01
MVKFIFCSERRSIKRVTVRALLITILMGGVVSCVSSGSRGGENIKDRTVRQAEMVGDWKGDGGARLVLNAKDHRFIGERLDVDVQEGRGVSISDAGLVGGKGEWGFGLYESGYQVTLYFDGGGALTLDVQEGKSGIQLSGWMKDMDQFILHRKKSS